MVQPSALNPDDVHGEVLVMARAPEEHLRQVRGLLVGQNNAIHVGGCLTHAVQVTEDEGQFEAKSFGMLPTAIATEDHRRTVQQPRRYAVLG